MTDEQIEEHTENRRKIFRYLEKQGYVFYYLLKIKYLS